MHVFHNTYCAVSCISVESAKFINNDPMSYSSLCCLTTVYKHSIICTRKGRISILHWSTGVQWINFRQFIVLAQDFDKRSSVSECDLSVKRSSVAIKLYSTDDTPLRSMQHSRSGIVCLIHVLYYTRHSMREQSIKWKRLGARVGNLEISLTQHWLWMLFLRVTLTLFASVWSSIEMAAK